VTAVSELAAAPPTDGALLAHVANGNLEALGQLFDRHAEGVRAFLVRMGATRADADDLLQATFLEVVRAAARFDPRFPARNWLLGIANAMFRRHRRSLRRAAARLVAAAGITRSTPPPTPAELPAGRFPFLLPQRVAGRLDEHVIERRRGDGDPRLDAAGRQGAQRLRDAIGEEVVERHRRDRGDLDQAVHPRPVRGRHAALSIFRRHDFVSRDGK